MTITIKLSLPHKSLSPNGRAHWACKAREAGKQHAIDFGDRLWPTDKQTR